MENSPRVLVVEDEIAHQDILESALEDGGFSVAKATTGEEALVMLDAEDAKYRAVITDVNLGSAKVTGWEVAKRAREKNSDLPIVYMTGGGGHDWGSMGVPNSVLLTKPFAAAQVVTAVSQLLNLGNTPGT
jgi:CheY-like chemotaxis protein